jgi:hypothetical protein
VGDEGLLKTGENQSEIAIAIGGNKSTIWQNSVAEKSEAAF